jgi:ribonuclease T1
MPLDQRRAVRVVVAVLAMVVAFQNRERLLPRRTSGYYHEFTVATAGESDRGALRIITGTSGERNWTDDHYESFRVIEDGAR